jgi:hypothetical protein
MQAVRTLQKGVARSGKQQDEHPCNRTDQLSLRGYGLPLVDFALAAANQAALATGGFVAPLLLYSRRLIWRRQGIVLGIDSFSLAFSLIV